MHVTLRAFIHHLFSPALPILFCTHREGVQAPPAAHRGGEPSEGWRRTVVAGVHSVPLGSVSVEYKSPWLLFTLKIAAFLLVQRVDLVNRLCRRHVG